MQINKRLMIIAGGTWQVPLVKKAKELGCFVVNSNLYEDSPGFKYADVTAVADVRDKEKNLQIAMQNHIDGVVTDQSDIAVPTVAYVADQLKLPSIGQSYAKLFTDKFEMRKFCRDHGFLYPEYKKCECAEEILGFLEKLGKKIIIKPIDSQSSRGVRTITMADKDKIGEYFNDAGQYSDDKKSIIAERYIEGTEFTVDGIKTPNGHVTVCISQKKHFDYNKSIASELFFSNINEKYDYEKLGHTNNRLIDATGLPYGLTHAEYKFENGEYILIEMAARGGGTKIASHIVPLMSGVDNYKYLICHALGIDAGDKIQIDPSYKNRCAVLKFLDFEVTGRPVKEIYGLDEVKQIPQVIDIGLDFQPGDIICRAEDDRSRAGYYIAYGESEKELRDLMEKVEATIKVIS